jgi:hypothetical protein
MRTKLALVRIALAFMIVHIFVPLLAGVSKAGECQITPIKPIQCVRGIVIDISGGPISNAKVAIFRSGTEIVSIRTGADGKFSFERLKAGDYEIPVEANNFHTARTSIGVVAPASKCKWALQVVLGFGFECDTGVARVKAKVIH